MLQADEIELPAHMQGGFALVAEALNRYPIPQAIQVLLDGLRRRGVHLRALAEPVGPRPVQATPDGGLRIPQLPAHPGLGEGRAPASVASG